MTAWLGHPEFSDIFDRHSRFREPGTAEWLFSEYIFRMWGSLEGDVLFQNLILGKQALWIISEYSFNYLPSPITMLT